MVKILVVYFSIFSVSLSHDPFFLLSGPPSNVIYKLDKRTKTYTDIPIVHRQPSSVKYDRTTGRIFFGTVDEKYVYSVKMDGSDSKEEAVSDVYAQAMAMDDIMRFLFVYSSGQSSSIKRVQLDATDPSKWYTLVLDNPNQNITHMTADPATRTLFMGSDIGVCTCNYNGTESVRILNSTASSNGITFDDTYIYAIRGNVIWRIKRSNNEVEQLFTISTKPNQTVQGLAAVDGHLFFALNYCEQGQASQYCDTYIYRMLTDGTQYEVFSALIRTPYCAMLKLLYVKPLQRNESTTTPCPEDNSGTCIHVVDDNFRNDSSASNNTLALCLILIPMALFLSAIVLFFCWKKMAKPQLCSEGDDAVNETLHSGQYLELREDEKF